MTSYYTRRDQVRLLPGETLGFKPGRGYYAEGQAQPLSEHGRGQGRPSARPAAVQPEPAIKPPPAKPQAQPVARPNLVAQAAPGATTPPQTAKAAAPVAKSRLAPATVSDAALSGGYGSRYYTYRKSAEQALVPGQRLGFTSGRGYYDYYPIGPTAAPTHPPATAAPAGPSRRPTQTAPAETSDPAAPSAGTAPAGGTTAMRSPEPASLSPPATAQRVLQSAAPPPHRLTGRSKPQREKPVSYDAGVVTYTIDVTQSAFTTISWPQTDGAVSVSFAPGGHIAVSGAVAFTDPGVVGYFAGTVSRSFSEILQTLYNKQKFPSPIAPFRLHVSVEGKQRVATIDHIDIEASSKIEDGRPSLEATVSSSFEVPGPDGRPITATYGITLTSKFALAVRRPYVDPVDVIDILIAAIVVRSATPASLPMRIGHGLGG